MIFTSHLTKYNIQVNNSFASFRFKLYSIITVLESHLRQGCHYASVMCIEISTNNAHICDFNTSWINEF